MAGEVKESELLAIARAINGVPDAMPLEQVPDWVHREVLNIGASRGAAELAKAIIFANLKMRGSPT